MATAARSSAHENGAAANIDKHALAAGEPADLQLRVRLYEAVLSNTSDFLYIFDLQHRFVYANDALLRVWGRSWEESVGKTL